MAPASSISTGLVNPKREMLSAICRTCFLECVRAFLAQGCEIADGNLFDVVAVVAVGFVGLVS